MLQYYGPINSPVHYFGWGFIVQGAVLGSVALAWRPASSSRNRQQTWRIIALAWLIALNALPWLVVIESGAWQTLGLFAITPDLTTLASLPCLVLLPRKLRVVLLLQLVLWAVFSALTLWTLGMTALVLLPLLTLALTPFAVVLRQR